LSSALSRGGLRRLVLDAAPDAEIFAALAGGGQGSGDGPSDAASEAASDAASDGPGRREIP
jgi:hypothetical protein